MKNRFYVDQEISQNQTIEVSKDELRHFKVTRIQKDELVEVINGRGSLAKASFDGDKSLVVKEVKTVSPAEYQSVLVQAMPESSHLDFIIEKGCELGITRFILFPAQKSKVRKLSENKSHRTQKLAISAMKQSKRLYLPDIEIVSSLDGITDLPSKVLLADSEGQRLTTTPKEDVAIIVGPESGFTSDEIEHFVSHLKAEKVSLGDYILRCETAAMISSHLLSQK